MFQSEPLSFTSEKNNLNVNPILFPNDNTHRSLNTLYNQNNNNSLNTLNNSNNNSIQQLHNSRYNDTIKNNIRNDSNFSSGLTSTDWLRNNKKVEEDVFVEKIPISHILIKMDKLQQLHYNNVKTVEDLNNRCVENSLQVNEVKNHLLERIEQGESKIIQLIYGYTEKQKNADTTWRNEQTDQVQVMQNSIHSLENYIRKFNVKISEHDSAIGNIQNQLNATEKRLEGLGKDYESKLQKLKQEIETNKLNMDKNFESLQQELTTLIKNSEKSYNTKFNSFKEVLQTEKSINTNTTNDLKKSINELSNIIQKVEEKEILGINSLKESLSSTQSILSTAIKDKDVQLRQYIDQSHEILSTKFNERYNHEQQQITEMTQKTVSLTNLMKEKIEGMTKQQTRQASDYNKSLVDFESKFTNSLQQKVKEVLMKISVIEETQKKKEEERVSSYSKMSENFKDLEKQCTHDINSFKATYNAKLDQTLQNYEEEIQKQLAAKDNTIEEINYKIVQLFSKVNNQEEAHQSTTDNLNKMIQDLDANEKKNSSTISKEMNSMISELKDQCQEINNKFDLVGEEQKKTVAEIENKFKFKYIQVDQILEAYKEDFKLCVNKKDMDEIIGQVNQTTSYQLQEMKKLIDEHQNSSEKELSTVHENVADQLHKIEEDLAKAKTTYITQSDYQELIEKMDKSTKQYNKSIQEINQMIDRMNHSLEIIDSNLVTSVTNNYNELTKKVDRCVTNYANASNANQTNQTVIQGLKDDIEKIKESFTVHKRGLNENEKVTLNQSKMLDSINETLEKLKQTNDLKLSKKEYQECLSKFENEHKDLMSMYEQVRQDYRDRETALKTQIKQLEDQWEENNSNNNKLSKQFKTDMEENLHKVNKQLTLIESFISEHKEKQRSIEEELSKREADLSSAKSVKLELDFLQEKLGKLPSEEMVRSLLTKSLQSIKENQDSLENEIADIRKTLRNHSLRNLLNNNDDESHNNSTNKNKNIIDDKINNNNNNNNTDSNTQNLSEPIQNPNQDIIITQDKDKEIIKEVNKREVELSSPSTTTEKPTTPLPSPSPLPPRPAVIITTREIIPLKYNNYDSKPKDTDTNSIGKLSIKEINEDNKNEKAINEDSLDQLHKKEENDQ